MAINQMQTQRPRKGQSTIKKRQQFSTRKRQKNKKVSERETKKRLILREGLLLFFVGLCILGLLQIKTHRVDGRSMLPTLQNNDRIMVRKNRSPNRYDLITFDPEIPEESSYVKRVIGIPGDQLWTDQTSVYLRPKQAGVWNDVNDQLTALQLPDSTLKLTVSAEVARKLRDISVIPEGSYFVLGDNRDASKDSRHFGLVEAEQIEGTVVYRFFPFSRVGRIN
ncbi:signal peptidase I [Enterococcus wangshanyuanii]|uniref:Signal peptidase I n=1 Tax=Enterococcus wangshanyuanii TaxID=2005703 RepID=A0ABQ1NIR8_9ENTE|nr:signal peptidase I [Enterococcus wangshanyuanii]GGC78340.1 signal peptidase I [Enterococcus wangshanyuanii]